MELFKPLAIAATALTTTIGSWFGLVPESAVRALDEKVQLLESRITETVSNPILGAYNVTGGKPYYLRNAIGLTDATIRLSSFKEPVSNLNYTMAYLNTTIGYGTLDPQSINRSEFISFTGITQNSDGTADLTGVTRGLTRTPAGSACTASTTLATRHPGQSTFILSDSPCHFAEYAVLRNDNIFLGQNANPEPSSASSTATKNYVDTTVAGGVVNVSKVVVTATAGETVSAGNILYLNNNDGEWYKLDTDIPTSLFDTIYGVAQGSGTDGVSISGGVLIRGLDTNQSGLTAGRPYFASATAGALSSATTSRVIGRARTSTNLYVDPNILNSLNGASTSYTGVNTFTATSTFASSTSIYDRNNIQLFKFGGNGSDGDLNISSGTTTVSLGGLSVVKKNYRSIAITGTGALEFSNAHASGTIVILKSQGNVTITSSARPAISVTGIGAAGGNAAVGTFGITNTLLSTIGGGVGANPAGGSAGTRITDGANINFVKQFTLAVGAGGGAGSSDSASGASGGGGGGGGGSVMTSGAAGAAAGGDGDESGVGGIGGNGGGVLYIEVGGAYNFTGRMNANGANGAVASLTGANGGSGGGGGGMIVVLYNILTANSGTYEAIGGAAGAATGSGGAGGAGGTGTTTALSNTEF